jgi:RHS repeat-associated protein
MALQRYDASWSGTQWSLPDHRGTWEEYRYDALGRRVVTQAKRDSSSLCNVTGYATCDSYVERVVWDGDDVLYEHREGGSQYTSGSVGYVHGGVIDQPIALLDGRILNPNWRGLYESSVLPNGTRGDCSLQGSGGCITVSWPAGQGVYYIRQPSSGGPNTPTWIGSLALNGAGSTGLLYRRNRFYDPSSGQFTQQDPIGLAGGLNQYGYANGDPVNLSDPFGLCPSCVGAVAGVATGFLIAKLTGADYGLKDAAVDAALGAVGGGIVSKLDKLNDLRKAAGAADDVVDATRGGKRVVEDVVERAAPGRDGGQSRHINEKVNAKTNSVTHQVERNGEIIHQHTTHVGKHGTQRRFPDEWTGKKTIDK